MPSKSKLVLPSIKLPPPKSSTKGPKPFKVLNPFGGEVFKMRARYPTLATPRNCQFRVFWMDGPYPKNLQIYLIDIKHWVTIATIAALLPNVPPGSVGMTPLSWQIPGTLRPSDDCNDPGTYPTKFGLYQIYIQDVPRTTWTYGPEFTIVWSE